MNEKRADRNSGDAVSAEPVTSDDLFRLFEHLLIAADVASRPDVQPILFDLIDTQERWYFDPTAAQTLFRRTDRGAATGADDDTFVLHCELGLLLRLVRDRAFALGEDDVASFEGDIRDLYAFAESIERGGSLLGLRTRGQR